MTSDPWWRGAVIYQIYPRSFFDSNDDGVGDLPGAAAKLDYVAGLGVDGIWLSPFFRSPMKDFGYDVSDYRDVDPIFGTLADFDALLSRAHALGLKVLIDQVYSHTSDEHPWFTESAAARTGPKADWYVWADAKADGLPPNNWLSVFGGPAWTWNARRRQYYLHNFLAEQPDLNFHNPEVQMAILDVARFWLDRGVDGFRLDVVNYYTHDLALRDNPPKVEGETPGWTYDFQQHLFDKSRPETLAFTARLRGLIEQYPGRMLLGEIGDDHPLERQIEYTAPGRLHTAYSFHLLEANAGTPELFARAIEAWRGAEGWPSWSLGNHDFARYPTRLGGANATPAQVNALLSALFFLRGTLFLYQGDELGLEQAEVPFEALQDPFAKRAYAGGSGRDGARTPFPWTSAAPNGGFSHAAHTWLPMDPRHLARAAETQVGAAGSHHAFTRGLIALRSAWPAMKIGEAEVLDAPEGVLAVRRTQGASSLLCVVNLGATPAVFTLPGLAGARELGLGLTHDRAGDELRLPAYGGGVFELG